MYCSLLILSGGYGVLYPDEMIQKLWPKVLFYQNYLLSMTIVYRCLINKSESFLDGEERVIIMI